MDVERERGRKGGREREEELSQKGVATSRPRMTAITKLVQDWLMSYYDCLSLCLRILQVANSRMALKRNEDYCI